MALRRTTAVTVFGLLVSCQEKVPEPETRPEFRQSSRSADEQKSEVAAPVTAAEPAEQLVKEDLVVGKGKEAETGDRVSVHYVGTLLDGTKFDSSRDRGQPFEFEIGKGMVIRGWDQGVPGMKVGGKRKLTIPSELGYGKEGSPPKIPPDATLVFEVELVDVEE